MVKKDIGRIDFSDQFRIMIIIIIIIIRHKTY